MSTCLNCGTEFEGEVGLCRDCKHEVALHLAKRTWKKQMKFYSLLMVAGLLVLGFAFPQLRAAHGDVSRELYMLSAAGGMLFLGGLFGLSLAVFFHLWHNHRDE